MSLLVAGCAGTRPIPGATTDPAPPGEVRGAAPHLATVSVTRASDGPLAGWLLALLRTREPTANSRHLICLPRPGFVFASRSHADAIVDDAAGMLVLDAKRHLERPRVALRVAYLLKASPEALAAAGRPGWLRFLTPDELEKMDERLRPPAPGPTLVVEDERPGPTAPGDAVEVDWRTADEPRHLIHQPPDVLRVGGLVEIVVPREFFEQKLCEEAFLGTAIGFLARGDSLTVRVAPGPVVVETRGGLDQAGGGGSAALRQPTRTPPVRVELEAGRTYHYVFTLRWFGAPAEVSAAPP